MRGKPIKMQPADESKSKQTHKQKNLLAIILVLSLIEAVFEFQFLPRIPFSTQIFNLKPTTLKDMKDFNLLEISFEGNRRVT
jgi:hypothetical protein